MLYLRRGESSRKPLPPVKPDFEASREAREVALNRARRRVVLDGAWRVFARDGLDGATMRAIAAEAGCTTGAIYPLFSSKEAIYAELLMESLDRLRECVESSISAARGPRTKLKASAIAFLSYYRDRPDEVALGLYLWHGLRPRGLSPDLNMELNKRLNGTLDLLHGALRALGHLSELKARLETSTLFAFLIGALIVHQTGRLRMLNSELDAIASAHLDALVSRLENARLPD
jgi:AcrR family transcriptional regulator